MSLGLLQKIKNLTTDEQLDAEIVKPEYGTMQAKADKFLEFARTYVITTEAEAVEANAQANAAFEHQKHVAEFMDPDISEARRPYKRLLDKKNAITVPYQEGNQLLKGKVLIWNQEQERKAEQERRRLEQEAEEKRKKEEAEEQERREKEAEAKKAELKQEAEQAEVEDRPEVAARLHQEADEIVPEPIETKPPAKPKVAVTAPTGAVKIKKKKTYDINVTNWDLVPIEYFRRDDVRQVVRKALLKTVKAQEGQIAIPGVEILIGEKAIN